MIEKVKVTQTKARGIVGFLTLEIQRFIVLDCTAVG